MSIVSSLVVMTQHVLALIVCTLVLRIKTTSKVRTEFTVLRALFIDLSKTSIVESFWIVSQHLSVEGVREAGVPFLGKLKVRCRERCNELIEQVEPVIHAIVPNDRFFCFNHCLYDQRKSHFVDEKFLLSVLWIDLASDNRRDLTALTLHALVRRCFWLFLSRINRRWVEGRPAELLTPNDV